MAWLEYVVIESRKIFFFLCPACLEENEVDETTTGEVACACGRTLHVDTPEEGLEDFMGEEEV